VYLVINGAKYWAMAGPSGVVLYQREGSKTRYLGRRPLDEVKRLLAQAGAETLQRIKSDIEAVRQALESQKTAATAQPSLTWKKDGHIYWLLQYGRTFYVYVKGPSTKHKPRLIEKTDATGVIGRLVAAGAVHALEALRLVVNGLHAAVVDLLRPRSAEARREASRKAEEAQVPRKEAEEAFRRLRGELSRAVKKWDEMWRREAEKRGYWGGPDRKWLRERLSELINAELHQVEKILPYKDLVDKFADAVEEAATGHLTRRDVLEVLKEL
jgi:hypothetical protein